MDEKRNEAWYRDQVYEDPYYLIDALHETRAIRNLPHGGLNRWREYTTSVGRADVVLAWYDHLVVVEFKLGRAAEDAISQVLRYAGALDYELHPTWFCRVVAAHQFTDNAVAAAEGAGVYLAQLDYDGFTGLTAAGHYESADHRILRAAVNTATHYDLLVGAQSRRRLLVDLSSEELPL